MPRTSHDRDAVLARLGDAKLRREGSGGLAEAVMRVDEREGRAVAHHLGRLPRHHLALAQPSDVARHPDHPVAVVTREVGGHEVAPDPLGLFGRAALPDEDVPDEGREPGGGDLHGFLPILMPNRE
jgi:hypothetical protein